MKNYRITVNGTAYDVEVEELAEGTVAAAPQPAKSAVVKAAPPQAVETPKPAVGGQGGEKITAPMPGKILSIKAAVGQAVTKGQVILVLEAMKMENEIVAPLDGTVASIDVSEGSSVEAGATLASMN